MSQFQCDGTPSIEIEGVPGDVLVTEGKTGTVTVLVSGPEKTVRQIEVQGDGNNIVVRGPKEWSGTIDYDAGHAGTRWAEIAKGPFKAAAFRGEKVFSGGTRMVNVCIGNVVKGAILGDARSEQASPPEANGTRDDAPALVEISVPAGSRLELKSAFRLLSTVALGTVSLDAARQSSALLSSAASVGGSVNDQSSVFVERAESIEGKLNVDGQGRLKLGGLKEASVNAALSGRLEVYGSFSHIDLRCESQARAVIEGNVSGSLTARTESQAKVESAGTCSSLDVVCESQSRFTHTGDVVGAAIARADSQAKITIEAGTIGAVDAKTDSQSRVITSGTVSGAYKARASSMSKITHSGVVKGPVDSRADCFMAKIDIG